MAVTVYVVECYDVEDNVLQCGMALTEEKAIEAMNEILKKIEKTNCNSFTDYHVTEYYLYEDRYTEFEY